MIRIGVWVKTTSGLKQVGYIAEGVNHDLANKIDKGWQTTARVKSLTGKEKGKTSGLVIDATVQK